MQETGGTELTTADMGGARLGLKSHLSAFPVPGEAVYLVSQRGVTALSGRPAAILVPLLDGSRDEPAVVRDAAPAMGRDDVLAALRSLEAAGLLRRRALGWAPDAPPQPVDRAEEAYWDLAGLDGSRVPYTVAARPVHLTALTDVDLDQVRNACAESGLTVTASRPDAALEIVLCDDYLDPRLAEIDAAHRLAGRPWLPVAVGTATSWVGPVFRPGEGPCWHCLATRLQDHRHSESPLRRALGLDGPPPRPMATLAAGRSMTVHLAVLEAAKWLAGVRNSAQDAVHTLDTLTSTAAAHPVARRPQCPACGDPGLVARRAAAPFVPVSRPKAARHLNGHRALTPAQMLERYAHLVDPVTGIIREIRRAPGSPSFVQAFLSGRNLAMRSASLAGLRAGLRSLSGGKGLTEEEARTSALGEAVERYSGTRHGDEPTLRASYRSLGPVAVHPNACQLYAEAQLADRDGWNERGSQLQYVPPRFDEDRPTDWTPVWSLTGRTRRLLPTSMLYYSDRAAPDGLCADSNGNAAGSCAEDALVQGFLELIERDAVALWWYNRTRHRAVALDAFDDPRIDRLRATYRDQHRETWALDLTSDFGIPVVVALSRRTDKPAEDVIFGFGAHFDPRVAVCRALTEMGQLLPLVAGVTPSGSGYRINDPDALAWWQHATPANQPYLWADPERPPAGPDAWTYAPTDDLLQDVSFLTELVRSKGMELLVLNQTRPDLELPVVKVIIPGLRHFWPRFGPGRLFTAPVSLGHRKEPTPYEELNPIPLFV
ncbi:TOMM precursor leader peptide-binding protein [Kitasatospora sp. NPDC087861]|uniref:TOMM precursor leader peptide-binding protein n=1 Tax=Kitasatospora sp. NPDC087861 TaxID=3364070 RepID=UPI00382F157F